MEDKELGPRCACGKHAKMSSAFIGLLSCGYLVLQQVRLKIKYMLPLTSGEIQGENDIILHFCPCVRTTVSSRFHCVSMQKQA